MGVIKESEAQAEFEKMVGELPDEVKSQFQSVALPFLTANGYFEVPASVKYHLNTRGGLFRHSVSVATEALRLNDLWFRLPRWKVIIAALFHDLGKLGNYDFYSKELYPRYAPDERYKVLCDLAAEGNTTVSLSGSEDLGFAHATQNNKSSYPFRYAGNDGVYADLTILDGAIAMKLMDLPADVVQACQFADGMYVDVNKGYDLKCEPLSYLIHWSDFYCGILKEQGKV